MFSFLPMQRHQARHAKRWESNQKANQKKAAENVYSAFHNFKAGVDASGVGPGMCVVCMGV